MSEIMSHFKDQTILLHAGPSAVRLAIPGRQLSESPSPVSTLPLHASDDVCKWPKSKVTHGLAYMCVHAYAQRVRTYLDACARARSIDACPRACTHAHVHVRLLAPPNSTSPDNPAKVRLGVKG